MKHLTEEQIAQYAEALSDGNPDKIDDKIREHVRDCNSCAEEVTEISMMIDEGLPQVISHDEKVKPLSRQLTLWFSIAAGIVLLVGVGAYFLYFQGNQQQMDPVVAEKENNSPEIKNVIEIAEIVDEKPVSEKETQTTDINEDLSEEVMQQKEFASKNQLAEAYRPSSRLEQLSARFDGVSMRSDGFEMRSEHILTTAKKDTLKISWIADQNQELIFSLYDNKENLVSESTVPVKEYSFVADFDKGLYYYKVINQDFDLLYCGKIIIE